MNLQEYKRRSLLPLAVLGLAAYYALVFVPLQHRAEALEAPLRKDWQKLCSALQQPSVSPVDFRHITNQLAETRQALALLESARQKVIARLELSPEVRARMNEPFQLVEYENARSQQLDELALQARQNGVAIDPAVFSGFPAHTADTRQPAVLWAALALVNGLMTTAIHSNVVAIHSLEVPVSLTNAPPPEGAGQWTEVPIQVEFTAPVVGATRLIQSLPLRAEEARALGLPGVPPDKSPLLIDGLVLKRQSPEKPDEVRVWLRAVGFVSRE